MAGDLDSAVESLRIFLKTHFTDINLYTSSKEARPVSLHKLFVNMEWEIEDEDSDSNLEASTSEQPAMVTQTKEQETSINTQTKDDAPVLQAFLKKVRIK